MNQFVILLVSITVIFTNSIAVAADESNLTVVAGIDFGFKQSSLNVTDKDGPLPYTVNPHYITLIPSITLAYGKIYSSLSYDTPLTESHTTFNGKSNNNEPFYSDRAYLRQEATLTLGYRILPALNIFIGQIRGETKIRQVDYRLVAGPPSAWRPEPKDIGFEATGNFAGFSSSYSFDGKGTLSFSAAYAGLTARKIDTDDKGPIAAKSQPANGYSTSLSWSGPMSDSVFYNVGYRYARYFYNFDELTIEEPIRGWTFGLRKYF